MYPARRYIRAMAERRAEVEVDPCIASGSRRCTAAAKSWDKSFKSATAIGR